MKKPIVLACALVLISFTGGAVFADSITPTVSGKTVSQVKVVRGAAIQTFTDDSGAATSVDLPGATTTIKVPSGQKATLLVRFSGETTCYGGYSPGGLDECFVQVLINGTPAAPGEVEFDTNNGNTEHPLSFEAHSFEWSSDRLGPGTYAIQVQVRVDDSMCCQVVFELARWTLAVERAD